MENPEEVLQALDEFQKMRPSEIPRELEEYLCWVAKTGDPVYQWSLVKPLFREKLTRVMTDFYESCPSLELAPCPNVDLFNYDIMKCALLELLDSFANAPFTVQRICELLTSPRKEYNRVDKFMRAIEKNILVVSTREPGPAARRSENGDGMVNGTLEDDALSSQSTHEVEMESWVKDCTTESAITGESNTPMLDTVITGKDTKILINDDISPILEDKNEIKTSQPAIDSNDIPITPIIATNVTDSPDDAICDTNSDNNSIDETVTPNTVIDLPEAVMNEDTSSQPSLDSEVEDSETGNLRKLQTTFQPKDFVKEDKPLEPYVEETKDDDEEEEEEEEEEEKQQQQQQQQQQPSRIEADSIIEADPITSSSSSDDSSEKSISESKLSFECQETVIPIVDNILEKRSRSESEDIDDSTSNVVEDGGSPFKKACSVLSENETELAEENEIFQVDSIDAKIEEECSKIEDDTIETITESSCDDRLAGEEENLKLKSDQVDVKDEIIDSTIDSLPETEKITEIQENSQPIVEEPSFEDNSEDSTSDSSRKTTEQPEISGVTIEEAMDDDNNKINKSIVPDPIPIVEEPKEIAEPKIRENESSTIITEISDNTKNFDTVEKTDIKNVIISESTIVDEDTRTSSMIEAATNIEEISQDDITDVRSSTIEVEEKIEPAESMEIDGDETMTVFQQDEPMEQEPGDSMKS